MNFSRIAVKRPVTTLMCILIAISFGILSIFNLKMDLFPNMNMPYALVLTSYESAGSEEIEKLITVPIEKSMGTVSGIKNIQSVSSNGSSMVMLEFESNIDIDMAAIDIREKIDLVKGSLPDDADDPMVMKLDINSMNSLTISASAKGKDPVELKRIIEDDVSNRLERQNGVASVSISGGRESEIRVVLKPEMLRGYGISESTISQLLSAENLNTPSGSVDQGDKHLTVRVKGEFKSIEEIRNIPITAPSGAIIYLRDIADITQVYKDITSTSYTNGEPSILLTIQKQSTANTVNVSSAVIKELDKIKAEMSDISFITIIDPADYINNSLSSVVDSAVQGGIFAIVILYIFLRNFRSTMIVGIAMPISIVSTFALMYYAGITLNMMSLGGLALGIGMLVDNSIVVLESIYKKLEEGVERKTASIEGAREVVLSVVASTLTTVAVFLPISFAGGIAAQIFNELSMTIAFSLFASLIVSITFVPMACSIILSPGTVGNIHKHNNIFTRFLDMVGVGISGIEAGYKRILSAALSHKKITMLIMVIFIGASFVSLPMVGMEFMPQSDEGIIMMDIKLPKGTLLAETEKISWEAIDKVREIPEIQDTFMSIGGGGMSISGSSEDSSMVYFRLVGKEKRERSSDQVSQEMRTKVQDIAGAEISVSASSSSMGSYGGSGIQIDIKGDELDTLKEISNDMVEIIKTIPEASEVKTSIENSSPQTTVRVNREKASAYGINSSSVASILRTAISGSVATTFKIDGDEYDIRIMQNSDKINYINDVESILIPTSNGANVPLYEIADIITEEAPVSISRDNQQKYVSVSASIENVDLQTINKQVEQKMKSYIMPKNYSWEFAGSSNQMTEAFGSLGLAMVIAVLLVYMIMAAEFESFLYPFIVMFSIPIAATGGLVGLIITGNALSVTGFLGIIMLAGIVVNNAIVLIDYANLLIRERGLNYFQAIKVAGPARLRPILMSTLTTVLGMIPMMISQKEGAEMMRGLATVVVFGLSLSTLITLLLIPTIYVGLNDIRAKRKEKRERKKLKNNIQPTGLDN